MGMFVWTPQTVHLKREHFIICKLHLNKVDFKMRVDEFAETGSRLEVLRGWGYGEWGVSYCLMGQSVWGDDRVVQHCGHN